MMESHVCPYRTRSRPVLATDTFPAKHLPRLMRSVDLIKTTTMKSVPLRSSVSFLVFALMPMFALAADESFYESDVRPILKAHCFHCHGEEEEHQGNLDLRLVRTMLSGGDSGPAIAPGKPDESLLLQQISQDDMPPGEKKLSAAEKQKIRAWLEQGARTRRPEPENASLALDWTEEERSFWSFQPVKRAGLPAVADSTALNSPVDAFLLARLEAESLTFSPETDRRTLIRRLSFDLLGLPPTPEQIEEFVNDPAPDALERLVDRMQASPAFGERWARHWLDVAGYADSDGYTDKDTPRPWAFRYRDYVIRSFSSDKPLDRFIVEQLAGDELAPQPYADLSPEQADALAATGFLRMAPDGTGDGSVDQKVARNDVVAETLKIVSSSLLGLTVGCAQCHSHRYDPISHEDYFRLRAIFEPALDWKAWRPPSARLVNLWTPAEREQASKVDAELKRIEEQRLAELDQIVAEIFEKKVAELPEDQQQFARDAKATPADKRTDEQKQILKDHPSLNVSRGSAYLYDRKRLDQFNKQYEKLTAEEKAKKPEPQFVACLTEVPGKIPETHLFYRGDFNQPRQVIKPGDLSVLGERAADVPEDDPQLPTSGRRLAYARQLTSGQHPLVPRVLVNRIWLHHFGRGLVATPSDFGILGERPSHPELLDWLADELVTTGWSMKRLQRHIVTSTAYRQTSRRTDALQEKDPENRLLGRMSLRRLEAEAIRDSILTVSGQLQPTRFGPPADVNPDEVGQVIIGKATRDGNGILVAKADNSPEQFRRSIYVQVRRSMPLGMLEPFDFPSAVPNCELRTSSTVAPQALLMMNSDFVIQQAERFAQRIVAEVGEDPAAQIKRAYELAFGAAPSDGELASALGFVKDQQVILSSRPTNDKTPAPLPPNQQALATLCHALLSSNRFLYLD